MFEKQIIIDGRGHIMGRLASYVAKELLNGQRIIIVRAEKVCVSGSLYRNKIKFQEFLNKKMNHNPRRGFKHYRMPSKFLWRVIRGMVPHKTARGAAAMGRLKVFEGIPAPYDQKKRKVIPDALKIVRLKNDREFCILDRLCGEMGWKKSAVVAKLEDKRLIRASAYYKKKLAEANKVRKALNMPEIKKISTELQQYGY